MKVCYRTRNFRADSLVKIDQANAIVDEYRAAGFSLTLRQLFYQFVSRELIPNTQRDYKNLGNLINDARLAGMVDWSAIEDRTRHLNSLNHWADPIQIVRAVASQYREDAWYNQLTRVEVWIEKDALLGVIEATCNRYRVPYFSCRGYTSASAMWSAAQRAIRRYQLQGGETTFRQYTTILHLGDHDPSGLAMTQDIENRLGEFCEHHGAPGPTVKRIALNMDQVQQYNPPPNTAKESDPRWQDYQEKYGDESWELDALSPEVIAALIDAEITGWIDDTRWEKAIAEEREARKALRVVADHWDTVSFDAMARWGA